jgi:hypothetical protein
MSAGALARFHDAVLDDAELTRLLLAEGSRAAFVARVVELAADRGLDVEPADVEELLRDRRRDWQGRWI